MNRWALPVLVGPSIIRARILDLDRTGSQRDLPCAGLPVPNHQGMPGLILLAHVPLQVLRYLGLERC